MHNPLTDKVALVTGSAHRVGKAIALELARRGSHILVHYNNAESEAKDTLREIKSLGVEAYAVRSDLGVPEGVAAAFDGLAEHFKRLDILVNSASIFQRRTIMDVTLEDWRQTIDINLTGPFLCTQRAVEMMRRNDPSGGVIINICDGGSFKPMKGYSHHSVSKAGLLMLTQVSAVDLGPDIRVNAVVPGPVLKPPNYSEERWHEIGQQSPIKRPGTAEDVARAVAYLCSEDYLTGSVLHVDGGERLI